MVSGALVGGVISAGLSLRADSPVSRRSAFRNGTCVSGLRSYRPLIDSPPWNSFCGSPGASCFHRQASAIAVRWPPAEWPAMNMRLRGTSKSLAFLYSHAPAETTCRQMCSTLTAGHSE